MKMRRLAGLGSILLVPLIVVGCDSTTSLDEVSLVGTWNGVGSLQASDEGQDITVYIESHAGGEISGVWEKRSSPVGIGSIANGSATNDEISFTLQGFPGVSPDPRFVGHLTDQHRMAGDIAEVDLSGAAVFRRSSVSSN